MLVVLVFASGLIESSTAILGAQAASRSQPAWAIVLSITSITLLVTLISLQARALLRFHSHHARDCWLHFEPPEKRSEIDDPLLAMLGRLCQVRPRNRDQGAFLMPDDSIEEPQRTELALARHFGCGRTCGGEQTLGRQERAGLQLEGLQTWLGDGTASRTGICFQLLLVLAQLTLAMSVGLLAGGSATTSVMQRVGFKVLTLHGVNVCLLAICALFTVAGTANDLWNGLLVSLGFALECAANALIFASVLLLYPVNHAVPEAAGGAVNTTTSHATLDAAPPPPRLSPAFSLNSSHAALPASTLGEEHVDRVASALLLAVCASVLLQVASFLPLLLQLYDAVAVPVVLRVWKEEAGAPLELACAAVLALAALPLQAAQTVLGINSDIGALIDEYGETATEVTTAMSVTEELGEELDGREATAMTPEP